MTETIQRDLAGNTLGDSWDFRNSDTQYGSHGIHTYLAAMIPGVADKLIRKTVPEQGSILDPFCGGGAVLVESIKHGFQPTGVDINPLAVLISKAKTTYLNNEILTGTYSNIVNNAQYGKDKGKIFPKSSKIDYWFKDYMIKPLSRLINQIKVIQDDKIRNFFECVFSATVRDVSLTYRNEQRLRRLEPEDLNKFNPDVYTTFQKRAKDAIKRLNFLPRDSSATVIHGSALDLPFKDGSFTNIICSPPYGDERNGVPYSQFSKNMLIWLGYNREDLLNLKKLTLGGMQKNDKLFESNYLDKVLKDLTKKQSLSEAISFYNDYFKAIKEMIRVTTSKISIVIGSRTLQARTIDNAQITIDFMNNQGCKLEERYKRTLPSKRLPQMGNNKGAQINEEDILIFAIKS